MSFSKGWQFCVVSDVETVVIIVDVIDSFVNVVSGNVELSDSKPWMIIYRGFIEIV